MNFQAQLLEKKLLQPDDKTRITITFTYGIPFVRCFVSFLSESNPVVSIVVSVKRARRKILGHRRSHTSVILQSKVRACRRF